jgi:hypothetical protein
LIGPTGPAGICDCSCVQYINTFTTDTSGGPQDVKIIYSIPNKMNYIVYGFDSAGLPSRLYIKVGDTPSHENGIGFVNDIGGNNEIDALHFAQIDLGDYIRVKTSKCANPTIKIGSIQLGEDFIIYGSNTLGLKGTQLYAYKNTTDNTDANSSKVIVIPSYNMTDLSKTGDIYLYGTLPFRYISIGTSTGNITFNVITFNLCSC